MNTNLNSQIGSPRVVSSEGWAAIAGVIGSEGLTEATSNVGVCASRDPADNMLVTPKDGNELLDTVVYLAVSALSDIGARERNPAAGARVGPGRGPLHPVRKRVFTHAVDNYHG